MKKNQNSVSMVSDVVSSYRASRRRVAAGLAVVSAAVAAATLGGASIASAQTVYTFGPQTSNTWLTPGNWTVGGNPATNYPGVDALNANVGGATNDVATFGTIDASITTIGINMSTAGGSLQLGAILFNGSKPASIGNNSAVAGTLQLNGATVDVGATGGVINNLAFAVGDSSVGNASIASTGSAVTRLSFGSPVSNVYVAASRTLTFSGNITVTSAAVGNTLVKLGAGMINNNGTIAHAGGVSVQGGTFSANGVLNNAGGFTVSNTGSLVVFNSNSTATFAGGLTVNGGTATLNSTNSNSFSGGLKVNGGVANIGGNFSQFSGGIDITGGSVSQASSGHTLGFTGGIRVSGGTLTLNPAAASNWSGGLTVSGTGLVVLQGANAFGPAAAVPNTFVINGGSVNVPGASSGANTYNVPVVINNSFNWVGSARGLTLSGPVTLNGSSTITAQNTAQTLAFTGVISDGTPAGALVKTGPGFVSLNGSHTFTGGVTLNSGPLFVGGFTISPTNPGTLLSSSLGLGTFTINGGSLYGSGGDLGANRINIAGDFNSGVGVAGAGSRQRIGGFTTVDLTGSTRTVTLTRYGALSAAAANFTSGNLNAFGLTSTVVGTNTYAPTVQNGTLRLVGGGPGAGDYSAFSLAGSTTFLNNAGLTIGPKVVTGLATSFPFGTTPSGMPSVTVEAGGILNLTDGANPRNPQVYSLSGAGLITNLSVVSNPAVSTLGQIQVQIQSPASAQFDGLIQDGADVASGLGLTGVNGTMGFNMLGSGTQVLTANNTFTGPAVIGGTGTVSVATLANAGVAQPLGKGGNSGSGMLQIRGGTLKYTGPAVSTDKLFLVPATGGSIDASGTGALTFANTGTIEVGETFARTFTTTTDSAVIAGVDTTGIAVGHEISGPGIAPGTTVAAIGSAGPLGTITLSGNVVSGVSSSFSIVSTSTNDRTFTLTGASLADNTFGPKLVNPVNSRLGLTKAGAGKWILGQAQSYTGPTTVTGGTLKLGAGATIASTLVTVDDAGTFDPTSAYPTAFPVAAGSTLVYNGNVLGPIASDGQVQNTTSASTTIANAISGTGSFAKPSGSGTVTFTGAVSFPAGVTLSQGLTVLAPTASLTATPNVAVFSNASLDVSALPGGLAIPAGGTLTMNGLVTGNVSNSGVVQISTGADRTYTANISGSGQLQKIDGNSISTLTGSLTYTGDTKVSAGTLIAKTPLRPVTGSLVVTGPGVSASLDPTGYASAAAFSRAGDFQDIVVGSNGQTGVSSVSVAHTARTGATPVKASVFVARSLSIATDSGTSLSGFVDLGNNDLIIKGGAASSETVRGYIAAWLGSVSTPVGLGSSAASPAAAPYTTLALFPNTADASNAYFSSYDGVSLDATDLIVKYTYVGDTNLDGTLNGQDFVNVIEGFSLGLTGWANGDVDHSGGAVTSADLSAFLAAYNYVTTTAGLPNYGNGVGGSNGSGAVPEPTGVALLAAAVPFLSRRRRVSVSSGN